MFSFQVNSIFCSFNNDVTFRSEKSRRKQFETNLGASDVADVVKRAGTGARIAEVTIYQLYHLLAV